MEAELKAVMFKKTYKGREMTAYDSAPKGERLPLERLVAESAQEGAVVTIVEDPEVPGLLSVQVEYESPWRLEFWEVDGAY